MFQKRQKGIDQVWAQGLYEPEIQVHFSPGILSGLGISPVDIANTIERYFVDQVVGSVQVYRQNWLVRVVGMNSDPAYIASLPIAGAQGELPLGSVASVMRGREKATNMVRFNGNPAFSSRLQNSVNTLDLVARINEYLAERNQHSAQNGVKLVLTDDLTETTRQSLHIMQINALLGLLAVLLVSWLFLGSRIAILVSIGIPFVLAGAFWLFDGMGQTLNVMVLLGIVISLGMLVDNAVVVVEAIYYRLAIVTATHARPCRQKMGSSS